MKMNISNAATRNAATTIIRAQDTETAQDAVLITNSIPACRNTGRNFRFHFSDYYFFIASEEVFSV